MFISDSLHSKLLNHASTIKNTNLKTLFENDGKRASRYLRTTGRLQIDFSKSLITDEILSALLEITTECRLQDQIEGMFRGDRINRTENRAVLHTALRAGANDEFYVNGRNVVADIQSTLSKMGSIAEALVSGEWKGVTGKSIQTVINIGIGGSDLGPSMAVLALSHYRVSQIEQYFVSNVDPSEISGVLEKCNPETTVFIIASKTFTTTETLLNAEIAKNWLETHLGVQSSLSAHFIALSTNVQAAVEFGVDSRNVLGFWDWVGGRFSLPSAIGLSLMIRIGKVQFAEFLRGMHDIDEYYRHSSFAENAIVLYSLLGIWYRNYLNFTSYAVLPYDSYLSRLPAYLQQLIMESNGKSVNLAGEPLDYDTSFIIWGEPGTNGQHSFHQLLHQGTDIVPVDFLFGATGLTTFSNSHDVLISNAIAQSEVLAFGSQEDSPPFKVMNGNRPSITFVYPQLNPYILGQIIAFYEHVVFTQGVIWGINSFDQWGVELGKKVAVSLLPLLQNDEVIGSKSSETMIALIKKMRGVK